MEIVVFVVCGIAALSCLSANLLIAYMIWQHWHDKKAEPVQPAMPEETPEEKEARRTAMEAQRLYDQGFIDMMSYMGMPPKKERDLI
jgi:hypothetical protein